MSFRRRGNEKANKLNAESVYKAHERSATCLDWHSTAPYILVSGSRDCTVKSYDLRAKDIHQLTFRYLFDYYV